MFEIIHNFLLLTNGSVGGVEVEVVVVDVCVTEFWMQYKFLFTYPSKKLRLFFTASFSRAGQQ
jgi:hypothetical protein